MKILITGASGFLGRSLVRRLSDKHELFCLTRNNQGNDQHQDGINWITMDLSQGLNTDKLPKKLDAIIHLAQSDGYRDFPAQATDVFTINISLVQQLSNYGLKAGISRMVLASTGSVYEPYAGSLKEDDSLRPGGYYGASKLSAELISEAYASHFAVSNLRVFFLYGPGQEGMLIARLIDRIKAGEPVTLPEDGKGLYFVPTFVEDCAFAFQVAVEGKWNGVYNISSPHAVYMLDLLKAIGTVCKKAPIINITPDPSPVPIVPNLDKAREVIEIDKFFDVYTGLEKTI